MKNKEYFLIRAFIIIYIIFLGIMFFKVGYPFTPELVGGIFSSVIILIFMGVWKKMKMDKRSVNKKFLFLIVAELIYIGIFYLLPLWTGCGAPSFFHPFGYLKPGYVCGLTISGLMISASPGPFFYFGLYALIATVILYLFYLIRSFSLIKKIIVNLLFVILCIIIALVLFSNITRGTFGKVSIANIFSAIIFIIIFLVLIAIYRWKKIKNSSFHKKFLFWIACEILLSLIFYLLPIPYPTPCDTPDFFHPLGRGYAICIQVIAFAPSYFFYFGLYALIITVLAYLSHLISKFFRKDKIATLNKKKFFI